MYAAPPVPPLTLTVPGSLCVEPGDVAALPGELVAEPADVVVPHPNPWRLSEYAGAAPAAMAIMQLADVTRIVSERKGPSSLVELASTSDTTPAGRRSFPAKPGAPFHGRLASAAASGLTGKVSVCIRPREPAARAQQL